MPAINNRNPFNQPAPTSSAALTVKGSPMNATQRACATTLITVGQSLGATTIALQACIFDAIYESAVGIDLGWNASNLIYGGPLAGAVTSFGQYGGAGSTAVAQQEATSFFKGGNGYQGGGAMALSLKSSDVAWIGSQVTAAVPYDSRGYSSQYLSQGFPFSSAIAEATAIVAANGGGSGAAGGVAGAGGSGTLTNDTGAGLTSGFTVGDPQNPDEDFWTAINRLCQERYWYVFSDGETLYLSDGPDLMKQTPAMQLDRIANLDQINHLDFVWDNTAWQYAATHKKRKRAQRRTSLAKVTSPVEATLDAVCAIDEVRAGDVIGFTNTGPGDGGWLVGNCRRSVFEILSEINLVIALTPLTEGALNPAGVNKNNITAQLYGGLGTGTGNYKGYTNPVPGWKPSRIDAGVDGTIVQAYLAPGDSVILVSHVSDAGWKGGGYVAGQLSNGPLKGLVWYVAEGVIPIVPTNATVKSGTGVARPVASPYNQIVGNIETGWAVPSIPTLPYGFNGNTNDQGPQAIAFGNSFNRFLVKLGASTGAVQGAGVGVAPASLPPGYP